jgi:hypothetical protein
MHAKADRGGRTFSAKRLAGERDRQETAALSPDIGRQDQAAQAGRKQCANIFFGPMTLRVDTESVATDRRLGYSLSSLDCFTEHRIPCFPAEST